MTFFSCKCFLLTTSLIFGLIFLILGLGALFLLPKFVNKAVYEQAYLGQDRNGTDNLMLKMFLDPPYDIRLQIWTISVKNPTEVVKNGSKPELVEKGPYTFNVHLHKTNVSFSADRTRMKFRNTRHYSFNPAQSCPKCNLTSDLVTVPNILFQKIVDLARKYHYVKFLAVLTAIVSNEKVFITVTVEELLFKGYKDPLISGLCEKFITKFCRIAKIPERIGLFYGQNGTDDGLYEVDTGILDANRLDQMISFNRMPDKLAPKYWYGPQARMINGTDAELFRPNLLNRPDLDIFIGQLCRSFTLKVRETASASGIPVLRYAKPDAALDVATQLAQGFCNPESYDFFKNHSIQQAGCAPAGLLDMSSCLPGSPRIFLSNAHFRNSPAGLRHSLSWPHATPTNDDLSYFDIEPITGVIVGVQQRHQLNLGMIGRNLSMTRLMRDMIVPMVWMNESAVIDPISRDRLLLPVRLFHWSFLGGISLITFGAVLLICFAAIFIGLKVAHHRRMTNPEEDTQHLIPSGDPFLSEEEQNQQPQASDNNNPPLNPN